VLVRIRIGDAGKAGEAEDAEGWAERLALMTSLLSLSLDVSQRRVRPKVAFGVWKPVLLIQI
jgi:hypothetical protein